MCGAGTTSVEKPLPTFQLHGSIITTSFHVAELGVMSQFIVRSDWGSNPAGSHYYFFPFFSFFCFFYGAYCVALTTVHDSNTVSGNGRNLKTKQD
jgi:hypothetical protein